MYDPRTPGEYAGDAVRHARTLEWPRWFHRHRGVEFFFDLRTDELGGPRTYHGIGWACACGRVEYGRGCLEDALTARKEYLK
jgi:hypothetical protein